MKTDNAANSISEHDNSYPTSAAFMSRFKGRLYRYRLILLSIWGIGLITIGYAGIDSRFAVTDHYNFDKIVHISVFAAMAFWPAIIYGRKLVSTILVMIITLCAPGLELMQAHFGHGRIASIADMSASLAGILAGIVLANILRKI
ncbi:hypothetical protein J4E05_10885 [Thalassospira sp. NFXS8]|jgi:hypothetical protein|uniref:VanZ family protein n=1 Tax=Thalassospira sp. NFXS8 TaxID=2819093 RepID=UPI0032DEF6B0